MKSIIQDIGRIQVNIRVKILDPIQARPRCKICRSQQSVLEMNRRTFPQAGIKACFAHLIFGNESKSSWYVFNEKNENRLSLWIGYPCNTSRIIITEYPLYRIDEFSISEDITHHPLATLRCWDVPLDFFRRSLRNFKIHLWPVDRTSADFGRIWKDVKWWESLKMDHQGYVNSFVLTLVQRPNCWISEGMSYGNIFKDSMQSNNFAHKAHLKVCPLFFNSKTTQNCGKDSRRTWHSDGSWPLRTWVGIMPLLPWNSWRWFCAWPKWPKYRSRSFEIFFSKPGGGKRWV